MLTYSRSLTQRTVSKYANGGARSAARGVAASAVVAPSSRAVSGQRVKTLAQIAISKYSTNPYLNIKKPEVGELSSMDMIAQVPPIVVNGKTAACDGGDGPLGHPKVFISLHLSTIEDAAPCEYCGLRFISTDYLEKELKSGKQYERGTHFLEPADLPDWEYNAANGGHH